jgi:hypothetical protein
MPTVDDRAAELFGVAISEAVRRAVKDVGIERLAERPGSEADPAIDLTDAAPAAPEPTIDLTDPYAFFGVAPSATWDEIVAARNQLLRTWHPDAGGDDDRLRMLNAAFAELKIRRDR